MVLFAVALYFKFKVDGYLESHNGEKADKKPSERPRGETHPLEVARDALSARPELRSQLRIENPGFSPFSST